MMAAAPESELWFFVRRVMREIFRIIRSDLATAGRWLRRILWGG